MTEEQKKQILSRMQRYCSLEDRSVQKVREKLLAIEEASESEIDEILSSLIDDRFLDEARFVESFIRSKINQKRWGVQKIKHGLFRHRIPATLIEEGIQNLDRKAYSANLKYLFDTKKSTTDDPGAWIRYLIQKGYLYDEIRELIES